MVAGTQYPPRIRRAAVALTLLALTASSAASAADAAYPSRPIRVVVATAAGGGVDAVARTLAPKLTESMGQT